MFGLGINRLGTSTSRLEGAISGLFKNGEAGVWYDPSDVEASLTWRRNLLEYTESLDNSYWSKIRGTVVAESVTDPFGGTNANSLTATDFAETYVHRTVNISEGSVVTFSGYIKKNNSDYCHLLLWNTGTTGVRCWFNLNNGTVASNAGFGTGYTFSDASIESVGNGWYRCSLTVNAQSGTSINSRFQPSNGDGDVNSSVGKSIYIFGAQTEEGSTATEYQPIRSTFDNAFKQAFPKHTLYQDEKGSTPVTALGQSVGEMLDKSQGLQFGNELVVNGTYDSNINGWTVPSGSASTISYSNGALAATRGNEAIAVSTLSTPVVTGKTYRLEFDIVSKSDTSGWVYVKLNSFFTYQNSTYGKSTGKKIYTFTATSGANVIEIFAGGVASFSFVIDNVSLVEVKGSHATQSNSTKRPVFARHPERGRVNLLKYTEEFDNGYWTKGGATTITANYSTAPDGTQTADRMVAPYAAGTYCVRSIPVTAGTNYVFSLYARATSGTDNVILSSPQVNTDFALDTNWKRISVTWTAPVTTNIDLTIDNGASAMDILIWGAQLEEANEATGYQKVVDDYDITESGYKSVYYLQFDGVNDGMKINNLTSSSTPLTALFGVELNANNKWLLDIQSGRTVFGGNQSDHSIFDGSWINGEPEVLNTPIVLTYDAVQSDLKIRTNGIVETTSSAYNENAIGGSISLFQSYTQSGSYVNGNMYQVVLRAAESTDKEIDQAEEFVAIKTGLKSEVVGLATLDLNFGANTYTARNSNGSVL